MVRDLAVMRPAEFGGGRNMTKHATISVVAGTLTVLSLAWLYVFFSPHPTRLDVRHHRALGEVLAGEAAQLLEPGARLFVLARSTEEHSLPASVAQLEGFQAALKRAGGKVALLKTYKLNPLRVGVVPPGDFYDLIRQGKDKDVIVSFLGVPRLNDEQLTRLAGKRPAVLAVYSGAMPAQVDLRSLFQQKLLRVAIISRKDATLQTNRQEGRASFDQMFKLITEGNLEELLPVAPRRE